MEPKFWLDADGKHIWVRHSCKGTLTTDRLPYGEPHGWHVDADGVSIKPSVECLTPGCGMHVMGKITDKPEDWVQP
jgi:hypothetical protein